MLHFGVHFCTDLACLTLSHDVINLGGRRKGGANPGHVLLCIDQLVDVFILVSCHVQIAN